MKGMDEEEFWSKNEIQHVKPVYIAGGYQEVLKGLSNMRSHV